MPATHWITELPIAATVCDRDGIILEMNQKSVSTFAADGGEKLIGTNVLDCHPEPARSKLAEILETGANDVYIVRDEAGKEILLPAIPSVILNIDMDARVIKVHLIDGLI